MNLKDTNVLDGLEDDYFNAGDGNGLLENQEL